jgi:hypothetical protein
LVHGGAGSRRVVGIGEFGQALSDVSQVALVFGVGGVGGGQPLADGEGGAVVLVGGGGVPGPDREVPEVVVADRQVALVSDLSRDTWPARRRQQPVDLRCCANSRLVLVTKNSSRDDAQR